MPKQAHDLLPEDDAIDLREQLRCVNRELAMRQQVYPKFVISGRYTQKRADHEIKCMTAVRDTLIDLIAPRS